MKLSEYANYDAIGLAQLIQNKEVSVEDVKNVALKAVDKVNPQINAVIETWTDESSNSQGILYGVPFLVKDLGLTVAGQKNELGSRLAQGNIATHDSDLMTNFRASGLHVLGRTTTPEFAASTTTESILSGATLNPWNTQHSTGGSSGGSAAAVASAIVPFAHATDGGGSIRVPASMGGIFGLKPSRGRMPMGPDVDEVWSGLAVHGVLTRSVRDSALLLDIMSGSAVGDPFQITHPNSSFLQLSQIKPQPLRIAVQTCPLNGKSIHPSVEKSLLKMVQTLEYLGHHVEEITPMIGISWEAFVEMNAKFWASNTASWIDAISTQTGRNIDQENLESATLALYQYGKNISATSFLGALYQRNIVTRKMGHIFQKYDVILSPTLADLAPEIGTYNASQDDLDGLGWINWVFDQSPFTALANIAGTPAMSIPTGYDSETGLPIGMQFIGKNGNEALLLSLATQIEKALAWIDKKPKIWAGNYQ